MNRRSVLVNLTAALGAAVFLPRLSHAGAKEHMVEIRDFEFAPAELTVKAGDSITWINRDLAPHTATALDGSWDTGELERGQSSTITVTPEMSTDYFCVFHPHMEAKLTIKT